MNDDHRLAAPFHAGELRAQALSGAARPLPANVPIRDRLSDQQRDFFPLLSFVCVALADAHGWPLATLLEGAPGFVTAPDAGRLALEALPAAADPAAPYIVAGAPVGLLGIDLATRRRNRVNGVLGVRTSGGFTVDVRQAFGNCPRYIQPRRLRQVRRVSGPTVEFGAELPERARLLVARSTTLFVASSAGAGVQGEAAGLDVSHRGGPAGFVRQEGAVLTLPDYAGNGYFNTFGNFLTEPRAAIVLADFASGDVLQLQGRVEIDWADGPDALGRSWRFTVARGVLRPGAFGLQEETGEAA